MVTFELGPAGAAAALPARRPAQPGLGGSRGRRRRPRAVDLDPRRQPLPRHRRRRRPYLPRGSVRASGSARRRRCASSPGRGDVLMLPPARRGALGLVLLRPGRLVHATGTSTWRSPRALGGRRVGRRGHRRPGSRHRRGAGPALALEGRGRVRATTSAYPRSTGWTTRTRSGPRASGSSKLVEAGDFPFDGTRTDFRPDPAWTVPTALPAGWDRPRAHVIQTSTPTPIRVDSCLPRRSGRMIGWYPARVRRPLTRARRQSTEQRAAPTPRWRRAHTLGSLAK